MTSFCCVCKSKNCSFESCSSPATLLVFVDILRNRTAAKDRVYRVPGFVLANFASIGEPQLRESYRWLLGQLYLLCQAHKQHIGLLDEPVIIQTPFCLCARLIVRGC